MTKPSNPQKRSKTLINFYNSKTSKTIFDQGVHDHDVLVDLVHIPEGGKMQVSQKLELCSENQDQIRNQRP